MPYDSQRLRWAAKVRQDKIRRLYELDARGLADEALIDEVGIALYARCRSILLVNSNQVECPRCMHIFPIQWQAEAEHEVIPCPTGCGWTTTGRQYHDSWRHHDLVGTNTPAFQQFIARYPHATAPQEKLLLIDQLIHAFHHSIRYPVPHRSAASNLIEGNHQQVVAFLDTLTYGDGSTPGLEETQKAWQETMREMQHFRGSRS